MSLHISALFPTVIKVGVVLLFLAACTEETLNLVEGGIEGTGLGNNTNSNIGPISGFGSIIVNGITYDTRRAEVFINGEVANFEQLRLGMQVAVNSIQENGRDIAEQISYQDNLRGPVMFISPSGNSLRIFGQTVRINEQTKFYDFEQVDELQVGDYLRVSGPSARPDGIRATLLERLPTPTDILVSGVVINLDATHQTFFIRDNGTLIVYQTVQVLPANLHNGQAVEVIATRKGPTLQANQIRLLDIQKPSPGASFIFNGTVTRFAGLDDFDVEYQSVRVDAETHINNNQQRDIVLGSQVKVTGSVDENGILVLDTINVIWVPVKQAVLPWRVSGPLEHIDLQGQQLTVFGVPVQLLPQTMFRDISGQFESFGLDDLRLGERVTAAGSVPGEGIIAESILYEPFVPDMRRQLQGLPTDIDSLNGTWRIFGVTVLTNDDTQFFDTLDNPPNLPPPGPPLVPPPNSITDETTFFTRLNSDILISASGEVQGNSLLADIVVLIQRLEE